MQSKPTQRNARRPASQHRSLAMQGKAVQATQAVVAKGVAGAGQVLAAAGTAVPDPEEVPRWDRRSL